MLWEKVVVHGHVMNSAQGPIHIGVIGHCHLGRYRIRHVHRCLHRIGRGILPGDAVRRVRRVLRHVGRDGALHVWLVFDKRKRVRLKIAVAREKLWVMEMLYDGTTFAIQHVRHIHCLPAKSQLFHGPAFDAYVSYRSRFHLVGVDTKRAPITYAGRKLSRRCPTAQGPVCWQRRREAYMRWSAIDVRSRSSNNTSSSRRFYT